MGLTRGESVNEGTIVDASDTKSVAVAPACHRGCKAHKDIGFETTFQTFIATHSTLEYRPSVGFQIHQQQLMVGCFYV